MPEFWCNVFVILLCILYSSSKYFWCHKLYNLSLSCAKFSFHGTQLVSWVDLVSLRGWHYGLIFSCSPGFVRFNQFLHLIHTAQEGAHNMHGCGSKSDARRAVLRPRLSRPRPCHEATRQQNYEVPHLSTRLSYKRHRRSYSWLLLACASLPAVVHAFVCPHLGVPRLVAELTTSGFRATHVDARSLMATSVRKTMALSFPFSRRGRRRSSNASSVALPDLRLTPPTMPAIQNRYRDSPWARFAGRSLKRSRDHDNDIVIDGACSDDPSATVADLCRSNGSRRFSFRLFREHFCALRRRLSHRAGSVLVAARQTTPTLRHSRQRIIGIVLASALSFVVLGRPAIAALVGEVMGKRGRSMMAMMPPATAGVTGGGAVMGETSVQSIAPKLAVWGLLFVTSAAFHSAEIAITTLYPWKVKEFAEEEGESSPFQASVPCSRRCI